MGVYFVDKGYIEIALYPWFERELLVLGCSRGLRGHYILPSSNNLIGIDLVRPEEIVSLGFMIGEELAIAGKEYIIGDKVNPDASCHDLAISWILPSLLHNSDQRNIFVNNVLQQYIDYHYNNNYILNQFSNYRLNIQWNNNLSTTIGSNLQIKEWGYRILESVNIFNDNYEEVRNYLLSSPYLLTYNVHGNYNVLGIGLINSALSNLYSNVYTTRREFKSFFYDSNNLIPALIVQKSACGGSLVNYDSQYTMEECCWPQEMIRSGIWSYFSISGAGYDINNMESKVEQSLFNGFIGEAIRQNPIGQFIAFGDITAHFPE